MTTNNTIIFDGTTLIGSYHKYAPRKNQEQGFFFKEPHLGLEESLLFSHERDERGGYKFVPDFIKKVHEQPLVELFNLPSPKVYLNPASGAVTWYFKIEEGLRDWIIGELAKLKNNPPSQ